MKVIFAGTPDFAVPTLQALIDSNHDVVCVLTQPDKPKGRGQKTTFTPVKTLAKDHHIEVLQPKTLKDDAINDELKMYQADVMVVVAYGLILPVQTLNLCRYGAINVHASLLPKYRGAAPIQAALLAGDDETGVTIMQMDKGLDTGDMLQIERCDIEPQDNSQMLHDKLSEIGGPALVDTLDKLTLGLLTPIKQDDAKANYAGKISKSDGLIDWQRTAKELTQQIKAYYGWPSCFSFINGKRFRVWKAALIDECTDGEPGVITDVSKSSVDISCSKGIVRLEEIQFDGGKRLPLSAVLNSNQHAFQVGRKLGELCKD